MRLVLDTGILVAALRSDAGASRQLVRAALEQRYALLLSVPLVLEYQAVLTRREHLHVAGLSADDVNAVIDALVLVAEPIRLAFLWRPLLKDPDDDMVLETAFNGGADLLVTLNHRDFGIIGKRFNLRVCSPRDALAYLRNNP